MKKGIVLLTGMIGIVSLLVWTIGLKDTIVFCVVVFFVTAFLVGLNIILKLKL